MLYHAIIWHMDEPAWNVNVTEGRMDNGNGQRVEPGNVTLYPIDWATIDALAKDKGLGRSAALRIIVREWTELKNELEQVRQAC